MSAKERLQEVQAMLVNDNVVDVKFCLAAPHGTPLIHVADDIKAFMLSAKQNGRPMARLGDSVRLQN